MAHRVFLSSGLNDALQNKDAATIGLILNAIESLSTAPLVLSEVKAVRALIKNAQASAWRKSGDHWSRISDAVFRLRTEVENEIRRTSSVA